MADHVQTSTPADQQPGSAATLVQKYAPTLFSAALLILGGLQVLVQTGATLVTILQFVALVLSTVTTFGLRGPWKIALEVAGVIVAAVLPFAIDHTLTLPNVLLVVIAVVKALATQFGVVVRADAQVAEPKAAGVVTYQAPDLPQLSDDEVSAELGVPFTRES